MKRKLQFIISATAASVLACSAQAQDTVTPQPERPNYSRDRMPHASGADQLNDSAKASELIGMTVKNNQGEKLGQVEEIAVDLESGRVVQVILSTGGFIGLGDRLSAVPPTALHHDIASKWLRLDADKEKLKSAPEFDMAKWPECCDSNHIWAVYRHYGQEPAFRFLHKGDSVLTGPRNTDGSPNLVTGRQADGTWSKDRLAQESQYLIPLSRLGQTQKASKLTGATVKNLQDEKLGQVDNLLIDLSAGRVVAVIITSGGFLGIGDELSAIPPTKFRLTSDQSILQLDASKEVLASAPHFKANQWPHFAEPAYVEGVYRAYKIEPYFNTNTNREADSTVRNVRLRQESALTPLDQGSSQSDVATTAQIRKGIMDGKDLSVNAQNVKVITNGGKVTLRGTVNTSEEKKFIGELANGIARTENVDNQLEVK